ncbi:MAG: S41 family peptidase [Pseudolabrys sp.]|nr:S41 family peptidase [Pseudolabrys sp.]
MMKNPRVAVTAAAAMSLVLLPVAFALGARSAGPSPTDLALIDGVIQLVERDYVRPVDAHELTKDALKGMLNRLDPHSDYMDEQEFRESQADISGKFGGLGIEISQQGGFPKVIAPIDGTPAARAGLQPGDLIVAVDGRNVQGENLDKVVRILRGRPGTSVKLTIARGDQPPFVVSITRSIIEVQTVKAKLQPNGIGYLRITEFAAETPKEVKKALNDLRLEAGAPLKGLVLDLRNDPGGLLTSAVAIAGDFLKGGTVVTIRGRRSADNQSYQVPPNGAIFADAPMVVLINGASASASEIVAGALQDRKRATIMGTQSFGKGSVQTVVPLNGHGALRLTTALYYTPGGRSIQGSGITPDVVVEAPKEQQIAGVILPHESELRGAFRNPGALGGRDDKTTTVEQRYSAPIRADLIGTDDDAQLKAALDYLARNLGKAAEQKKG